ncbi:MAG: hypothetical protein JRD93_15150 [Deltaproteobacteria bacterium]|nr:hypothetical protein [Deltaproteobacteria bacterium]
MAEIIAEDVEKKVCFKRVALPSESPKGLSFIFYPFLLKIRPHLEGSPTGTLAYRIPVKSKIGKLFWGKPVEGGYYAKK